MRYVLLLLVASALPAQHLGDVIEGMEFHYNRLATLQTEFEQTLLYGGSPRDVQRGTLYLYRPRKIRWDYTKPKGQLLIGDGEIMKMYSPRTNQVRTMQLTDTADMRAPLAFLLGGLNLRRQFKNLELATIDGKPAMVGQGRTGKEGFTKVEFFYDPGADFRLDKLQVYMRNDAIMVFTFDNEIVNVKLDESMFEFKAPPGAEILSEQQIGGGE